MTKRRAVAWGLLFTSYGASAAYVGHQLVAPQVVPVEVRDTTVVVRTEVRVDTVLATDTLFVALPSTRDTVWATHIRTVQLPPITVVMVDTLRVPAVPETVYVGGASEARPANDEWLRVLWPWYRDDGR